MDELLEILMRDKGWNDGQARKTFVAVLEIMSKPTAPKGEAAASDSKLEVAGKSAVTPSDPIVDAYRRRLSMTLF
jgi:putative thioredoxin